MIKNKKGFSLVELIVVIAILVVFAAILIPSLLQYTENSRAQKDVSTMDEVVNAVQLALADEKCFDEALQYSCTNNYLTYSDSSGNYGQQINDGEFWAPDGSGRATTITFNPEYGSNNQIIYDISKGIINDMTYGNGSVAQDRVMEGALIENNQCYFSKLPHTYNTVKQTVGADVITTSQTYRNSSFTVFIKFNQKDGATVADVNGSFNGTNLYEGANASKGTGTSEYDENNNAIITVTTPGTQKSEYTSSDLGGTGSLGGSVTIANKIEDYKQPTYIENLQKENEFEYYSSLYVAIQDVNNGTIGQNADVHKEDGVAGIYVDDGKISVVLLKDTVENTANLYTYKDVTIVLGGHTIMLQNINGFTSKSGKLIVDGRIDGSTVKSISTVTKCRCVSVYADGFAEIYGGTYISEQPSVVDMEALGSPLMGPVWAQGPINIYDANFIGISNDKCYIRLVETQNNNHNYIIKNCTFKLTNRLSPSSPGSGTVSTCIFTTAKYLTVENCIFYAESNNRYTGAVYMNKQAGGCTFKNCDTTILSVDGREVSCWRETDSVLYTIIGGTGQYGIAFQS